MTVIGDAGTVTFAEDLGALFLRLMDGDRTVLEEAESVPLVRIIVARLAQARLLAKPDSAVAERDSE